MNLNASDMITTVNRWTKTREEQIFCSIEPRKDYSERDDEVAWIYQTSFTVPSSKRIFPPLINSNWIREASWAFCWSKIDWAISYWAARLESINENLMFLFSLASIDQDNSSRVNKSYLFKIFCQTQSRCRRTSICFSNPSRSWR